MWMSLTFPVLRAQTRAAHGMSMVKVVATNAWGQETCGNLSGVNINNAVTRTVGHSDGISAMAVAWNGEGAWFPGFLESEVGAGH